MERSKSSVNQLFGIVELLSNESSFEKCLIVAIADDTFIESHDHFHNAETEMSRLILFSSASTVLCAVSFLLFPCTNNRTTLVREFHIFYSQNSHTRMIYFSRSEIVQAET